MQLPARLVIFRLAGQRLALDLALVSEVTEPPRTWPIPLVPPYFIGAMTSHGSLVSLLDLGRFLGCGSGDGERKVLVIDRRLAALALLVDGVERIMLREEVVSEREGDKPMVSRFLAVDGGEVALLSPELLLEAVEQELHGILTGGHAA